MTVQEAYKIANKPFLIERNIPLSYCKDLGEAWVFSFWVDDDPHMFIAPFYVNKVTGECHPFLCVHNKENYKRLREGKDIPIEIVLNQL